MTINSKVVIDHYIKRLDKSKYNVMLIHENGIQMKQLKQVNKLGVWSGLFLLPFWGIGLIIWLLVVLDYLFQREKVMFITVDQMVNQFKRAK